MKNYLLIAVLFVSSVMAFSQELAMHNSKVINGPVISWDMQHVDMGTLEKGIAASTDFTFTNNGNEAVVIESVKTTCGCTASEYPKEAIAPGKTARVKVSYNAKNVGSFSKTITVHSNSIEPISVLNIKGTVN